MYFDKHKLSSVDPELACDELEDSMNNLTLAVASQEDIGKWTNNKKLVLKSIAEKEHWAFRGSPYNAQEFHDVEISMENNIGLSHLVDEIGKAVPKKVFICRTITPSIGGGGRYEPVGTAVEDLHGRVVRMSLFNYSNTTKGVKPVGVVLPEGTIIAVKNPPLHVLENEKGQSRVAVCALNPGDVELLSYKTFWKLFPGHSWRKTVKNPLWKGSLEKDIGKKLKGLGNDFFVEGRWTDALRWYKLSLEYFFENPEDPETQILWVQVFLNKAAAHLQMGLYIPAGANTDMVLKKWPDNIKAIYRRTKAMFGLKRYEKALTYLDGEFKRNPELAKNEDLMIMRERAEILFKAKTHTEIGERELSKLVSTYLESPESIELEDTSEIAEISSPLVKIKSIPFKTTQYRGLVATEDLPQGKLLICEKAFGYLKAGEISLESYSSPEIAMREKTALIVAEIANKIAFYPDFGEEFYDLWAGPQLHSHFVDQFLTKQIDHYDKKMEKKVNLKRIEGIVKMNSFVCPSNDLDKNGLGLWIMPSYLNHCCSEANANWKVYGDVMVIRTFNEIKKGQEVFISYIDPAIPYEARKSYFLKRGFLCKCPLCRLDAAEDPSISKERQEIMRWFAFNSIFGFAVHPLDHVADNFMKLLKFRKEAPDLNPYLRFHAISITNWISRLTTSGRSSDAMFFLSQIINGLQDFAYLQNYKVISECLLLRCQIEVEDKKDRVKETVRRIRASLKILYGTVGCVKESSLNETLELVKFYLGKDFFED